MIAPREIVADRLTLRPYRSADATLALAAIRESIASVGRWLPWCHQNYDESDSRAWVENCEAGWRDGAAYEFAVFDRAGAYVGGVGLNQLDALNNRANLGYWIRESRQGEGLAAAAARLAVAFGFEEVRLTRIEIVVASGNEASLRVARKLGARFECIARNRLVLAAKPVPAAVYSLLPGDVATAAS